MQKVLSSDIWKEIGKRAKAADRRKAAIAYVTKDQIGFQTGDILVVDASHRAIATGQTDAPLLRELNRNGVAIYSKEGLHAKVLLLGSHSVIGSANMSNSSESLIEAAVISDSDVVASGVESFIAQLTTKKARLTSTLIEKLCKIPVTRTGWAKGGKRSKAKKRIRSLGNRTWILGVNELLRDPPADEQNHIDRANAHLNERLVADEEEYAWIRWGKLDKFAKECREGDTLIQIYNKRNGTRRVSCSIPVLLKRNEPKWTRFYLGHRPSKSDHVSWTKFQEILRKIKYARKVGPHSIQQLDPEVAELLQTQWRRTANAGARKPKA
jgi:hypothetical protein